MNSNRINLLNLDLQKLTAYCLQRGEKPFRAKQLLRWIHHSGIDCFESMTDIAKSLRQKLQAETEICSPTVLSDHTSTDGTRKWLLDVGAGNAIETVFIPETHRATLCISSQAGCAVNCHFCSTGKQGFSRNLDTAEIISQLRMAEHAMRKQYGTPNTRVISNVVMMGMGEPLLNFENVVHAISIMLDDHAYGLSRRRVTLSTSGVVPMIDRLAHELPIALAVSLHAPDDALRDHLVPLNKKYPLKELLAACTRYLEHAPRDFITFEYCMLDQINDSHAHAIALVQLIKHIPCKINLIPFNPFPNSQLQRSPHERVLAFSRIIQDAGIVTTIRKTRGDDIDAACGQLAGTIKDRTSLTLRRQSVSPKTSRTILIHPQFN